jgi:mono/diheme cytochrome c family protein
MTSLLQQVRQPLLSPSFTRKGAGLSPFTGNMRLVARRNVDPAQSLRREERKMMRIVMLASILAASTLAANAQEASGDSEAGRVYAREVCSPCHAVTAEQATQRMIAIAPDFQTIANTGGMTATALRAFL